MKLPYIPLRVHTAFSEGSLTPPEIIELTARLGIPSIAITDLSSLHAWGWMRREAKKAGLKLLYGVEIDAEGGRLVYLVKDRNGFRTLLRALNCRNFGETEGVIRIFVPAERMPRRPDFLQASHTYVGIETGNRNFALWLASEWKLPPVLAQPLQYTDLDRLILLRSIRKGVPFPKLKAELWKRMLHNRILSRRELTGIFGSLAGELTRRTFEIAEMCEFDPEGKFPNLPEGLFPFTLRELCLTLVRKKFSYKVSENFMRRLLHELDVIEKMGFAPYFLLVRELVSYARRCGILHNLRGSGASSLVAYVLGISHVNPLGHDLYFERFLNRGRPSPPDIDIDFEAGGREKVLSYLFGPEFPLQDKVGRAMISTFRFYGARSALYDTLRAFGFSPQESAELRSRIPHCEEPNVLRECASPLGFRRIYRLAASLCGIPREISLHVGGVLFVPQPLVDYLPVRSSTKVFPQCHFDKDTVEDLKLMKLDLLSVRGLRVISECMKQAHISELPEADEDVYRILSKGETIGCFQIESPGMMALLKRMKPRNLKELSFALALIRPGPTECGMKELYLSVRENKRSPDPLFFRLFPETGGVLIFEEQMLQAIVRTLGVSVEEAELIRRELKAGGSKELKTLFLREGKRRGLKENEVLRIYKLFVEFSSYSFNRAHSVSYAWMAEKALYLKIHHPVEFFCALLKADGGYYGLHAYIEEAKRRGIKILPPCVLRSAEDFSVEGNAIRTGLSKVKYLHKTTIRRILIEREKRPFSSLLEFLQRIRPDLREKLSLMDSGALDSLEPQRSRQLTLLLGKDIELDVSDLPEREKKKRQLEVLGFLPEGHPLELIERPLVRVKKLDEFEDGGLVDIALYVLDARLKRAKNRNLFFLLLEDETGIIEGIAREEIAAKIRSPFLRVRAKVRRIHDDLRLELIDALPLHFQVGLSTLSASSHIQRSISANT